MSKHDKAPTVNLMLLQMQADAHYRAGNLKSALQGWEKAAKYADIVGKFEVAKALRERIVELSK